MELLTQKALKAHAKGRANAYDVARSLDLPVIIFPRHEGSGSYRDGELCYVAAARPGRKIPETGTEKRGLFRENESPWVSFNEAATFLRSRYKTLADCGFTHWKGAYLPTSDGTDVPCGLRGYNFCSRPIKTNGMCGQHAAAATRRETEAVAKAEATADAQERSDAGERIAKDALTALDGTGIEAEAVAHGYPRRYTGEVTMHAEDLLALTRLLDYTDPNWRERIPGKNTP